MLRNLKEQAKALKAEARVMAFAYADKRTPLLPKLLIAFTLAYLVSPVDLIPDFIPVLGLLDDLILVPFLIRLSIKLIPEVVMNEARAKAGDNKSYSTKSGRIIAVAIVLVWITVIYWIGKKVVRFQSGHTLQLM